MNKNLSKSELVQKLAEAELKILNLKKKNKKLAKEVEMWEEAHDKVSTDLNEIEHKYELCLGQDDVDDE